MQDIFEGFNINETFLNIELVFQNYFMLNCMIDCFVFYVSAIFQPCYGGKNKKKYLLTNKP